MTADEALGLVSSAMDGYGDEALHALKVLEAVLKYADQVVESDARHCGRPGVRTAVLNLEEALGGLP